MADPLPFHRRPRPLLLAAGVLGLAALAASWPRPPWVVLAVAAIGMGLPLALRALGEARRQKLRVEAAAGATLVGFLGVAAALSVGLAVLWALNR